jgi:hypothetical protein
MNGEKSYVGRSFTTAFPLDVSRLASSPIPCLVTASYNSPLSSPVLGLTSASWSSPLSSHGRPVH